MGRKSKVEEQVEEFIRCKNSFLYFCHNYVLLELPGGDIFFHPYKKQLDLIGLIEHYKHVLALKSRQVGVSTVIEAYAAWLSVFYDNVVVGVISKDGSEATKFARTIRGFVDKLPTFLKPPKGSSGRGFAKRSERSFILTNGSKVYSSPVDPKKPDSTFRGSAITFLIIDEAAHIKYLDEAWTGMVSALSTNQSQAKAAGIPYGTVILSTPNKTVGVGKWYYDRYSHAIADPSYIFKPMEIYWRDIPELVDDPSWFKTQCEMFDNDPRKIRQELELKFLPSEGSFFDPDTIEKVQEAVVEPIEKMKLYNGEVWVFDRPERDRFYLIGVDTASERGDDLSAITVWDYETLKQVWEYNGKCQVKEFLNVVKLAMLQYTGITVIEANSYGNQLLEELNDGDLSVLLYKEKQGEKKIVPGITTTAKTRPLMIEALYSYISRYPESIKSKRLSLELSGLVEKKNGRVEGDSGSKDDLVLSAAVAFYVRKYDSSRLMFDSPLFKEQTDTFKNIMENNVGKEVKFGKDVMRHVKDTYFEKPNQDGYIDIFSLYTRE